MFISFLFVVVFPFSSMIEPQAEVGQEPIMFFYLESVGFGAGLSISRRPDSRLTDWEENFLRLGLFFGGRE